MENSPLSGTMPLSVTQLTAGIKQLLESRYSGIEVAGEVSRLTRHASGHIYFTIKDAHASISAVIWRSAAVRLTLLPKDGEQFIFTGHISVYEPRGTYQLIVRKVEAAGAGQLAAEFERRKALFSERGWFDPEIKKALPPLPEHIGIITSETAAAFEDVKKVLATRPGWLRLTLAPAVVQGDAAPASIRHAIKRLNRMQSGPDLILLVRGGGSMEDLWCFNDELVVKAIVESGIPVITGIGHEIDTTLADFAADVRAATPSNAAELASPDRDTLRSQLPKVSRLQHIWQQAQDRRHQHCERGAIQLTANFRQQIAFRHRLLTEIRQKLALQEPRRQLRLREQTLHRCQQHLTTFRLHGRNRQQQKLEQLRQQLIWLQRKQIEIIRQSVAGLTRQLHDLGPTQVLKRGYTMSMDAEGKLLTSVNQLAAGDSVDIRFHDGIAAAETRKISKASRA
ncbi:MAG: exodeoxyribonuclease VII large subunit [Mariprofundaceae bacterium]|nr:exodeoxyribonuclease VII large subunit [Mariprofundaceae bacterium]